MIIRYDKNNNPVLVPETKVNHDDKWRKTISEEFRKVYGAWWIFNNVPIKHKRYKKAWIEQFRKEVKNHDQ